jgi:hypothetical protein
VIGQRSDLVDPAREGTMEHLVGFAVSNSMPGLFAAVLAMCWIMTWDWLNRQGPLIAPERGRRGFLLAAPSRQNPTFVLEGGS